MKQALGRKMSMRGHDVRDWNARVAVAVREQAGIEAAFDRADGFDRLGDARRALDWLDRADRLSGGLSPAYLAKRERLARGVARANAAEPGAPAR